MNFGSSVLHIVVESATDCCRYVDVVDTIEQLLMVHIVECSCQIERDEYCTVSRIFALKAGSKFGGDRRQCSACRVFRRKAMLNMVEGGACQYFWQQEHIGAYWLFGLNVGFWLQR